MINTINGKFYNIGNKLDLKLQSTLGASPEVESTIYNKLERPVINFLLDQIAQPMQESLIKIDIDAQ